MSNFTNLNIDSELATESEKILDDMGLDLQIFFKMCMKKLVKEHNIIFLTADNSSFKTDNRKEDNLMELNNLEEEKFIMPISITKNKITNEMRDCVWEIFKNQYILNGKIKYPYSEQLAISKCGINQGSAHIYFSFLYNLVSGIPNTRVVKYSDLVLYLDCIKKQLPALCIENAIKSLKESIPYWKKHTTLSSYADKVANLILKY